MFFVVFYYHVISAGFTLMYFKIPLIEGWQTESDGVDEFFFYKRLIPLGYNFIQAPTGAI